MRRFHRVAVALGWRDKLPLDRRPKFPCYRLTFLLDVAIKIQLNIPNVSGQAVEMREGRIRSFVVAAVVLVHRTSRVGVLVFDLRIGAGWLAAMAVVHGRHRRVAIFLI